MFRLTPGRVIVVLIVLLGVSLAAFNVWFRYATTNKIHDRWGTEAMQRIADAPEASWWELEPLTSGETLPQGADGIYFNSQSYAMRRQGDLMAARGFVNLRYALGQNGSYDFNGDEAPPSKWRWAMIFLTHGDKTIVLIDEEFRWLWAIDLTASKKSGEPEVMLTEKMSAGMKTFFDEQRSAR